MTKGRGLDLDPAHVAGFCLATAILSAICHLGFERTVWPAGAIQWGALAALAVFPLGFAFSPGHGVKRGDIQVLGAASYLAPLLSTLLLILSGNGRFDASVGFAAVAITVGAVIASKDMLLRKTGSDAKA